MYNIGYMYDDNFMEKINEYPYQVISDKESLRKNIRIYIFQNIMTNQMISKHGLIKLKNLLEKWDCQRGKRI